MFSRTFFFLVPLAVILAILAFSAVAKEKKPAASFREQIEKNNVDELAAPDIPDPEATPERPQQNLKTKPAPAEHAMEPYGRPTLRHVLAPSSPLEKGKETSFTLSLKDKGGQPVTLDGLVERHTQKIHLLVVDESLTDYHHIHPVAGKEPGTYTFSFTPLTGYSYMLYVDVKPVDGTPQMLPVLVAGVEKCNETCVDKAVVDKAVFGGNKASLSFASKTLHAGKPARGELFLTTGDDSTPLKNLEPVMGAYGHIVGFYEGFGAVAHIHPLGKEPEQDTDRGASPLSFMLHPESPGFMKVFVQLRVDGKDVFLPFSIFIDP